MPVYEYKHLEAHCEQAGPVLEATQSIKEQALSACPYCGAPVERIISRVNVLFPQTNTKLKEMGFSKLVRRDKGVYENVTAQNNESRYFEAGNPETMPNLKKRLK